MKKRFFIFLCGIALALFLSSCGGMSKKKGDESISLADRIEAAEDRTGTFSFAEMTSPLGDSRFEHRPGPLNLGLTTSVYWFRLKLDPSDFARNRGRSFVSLGEFLEQVEAYATNDPEAHTGWQLLHGTDPSRRGETVHGFELPESMPAPAWLLFRVDCLDTLVFAPRINETSQYTGRMVGSSMRRGVYYGVMGGVIVYNLVLALWLRDRACALYVLFELLVCITIGCMDRTFLNFIPWAVDALRLGFAERLVGATGIAAVLFANEFLDMKQDRRMNIATKVTVAIGAVIALFPIWLGHQTYYVFVYTFTIGLTALVLAMAFFSWQRKDENAILFLLAWGTFLSVVVVGSLMNLGLVTPLIGIMDAVRIGSGAEALLLAIAIARRLSLMRRAEEDARTALAEARLGLSTMLKRQIISLNTLVSGVAHEIGNPLNFAAGGARDAAKRLEEAEALALSLGQAWNAQQYGSLRKSLTAAGRSAALAARGTERIGGIVRTLRTYVGSGQRTSEVIDLDQCIRTVVARLDDHLWSRNIEIVLELGLRTPVACCEAEMSQVFTHLVLNASQAMPDGGEILIATEEGEDVLRIVIADTGPGVPNSQRQAIFDPFFTTRAPNEGTGLGLAVSLEIVRRHGGMLELLPPLEEALGAQFAITLPLSR